MEDTLCFQSALLTHAEATKVLLQEQLQALEENKEAPKRLVKAMRYALLGSAKRLRPFLVCESARLFGDITPGALWVATAVEYAHTYSLIHDDLPAMDDDDFRRGEPTVHKAFDDATAILAGDGLLTEAFLLMSQPQIHEDPAIRVRLITAFAKDLGIRGMVGGQMHDLLAEQRYGAHRCTQETVEQLQRMKTGALFAFSAQAGAILHRQPLHICHALEAYGYAMGIAFQIRDDVLDGGSEVKDATSSPTLCALIGREGAQKLLDQYISDALECLRPFGSRAHALRDAAYFAGQRQI